MKFTSYHLAINTPLRMLTVLLSFIAVAELLIMLLLQEVLVPAVFSVAAWKYVHALLLVLISAPVLYFLVFKKLQNDVAVHSRLTEELEHYRQNMEEVVQKRTAALVQSKNAAEAARHANNIFLADISHEIRVSLNSIIGWNYLLQKEVEIPRQLDQVVKVGEAANHLLKVVNNMMDLSRIEAGMCVLEKTDFDLARLVESTVSMLSEQANIKGLYISVELDPQIPRQLNADPLRLGQILFNFVSNAIRYSEAGSITVRAKVVKDMSQHMLIRIEVADQGIGLSRAQQENLFHKFQQVDDVTTRELGASGLGLVISRQLATLMGGDIGVTSEYGSGSTFWMEVGMEKSTGSGALAEIGRLLLSEPPVSIIARRFGGVRILLAEDDLFNQEVALGLLEETGLIIDVVENGQLAVQKMMSDDYALVLMDVQMPVMDGLAATRHIRQQPGKSDLPILALTANAFDEDRKRCIEAGMSDYISKPVDPEMLFSLLLHWLEKSAKRGQVQ